MTVRRIRRFGRPVGHPSTINASNGSTRYPAQVNSYAHAAYGQEVPIRNTQSQTPARYSNRPVGLAGARRHHHRPIQTANRIPAHRAPTRMIRRGVHGAPRVQFTAVSSSPVITNGRASRPADTNTRPVPGRCAARLC